MRVTAVQLIVSVLFLVTACVSLDEHVRRFKELYVAAVSSMLDDSPGRTCCDAVRPAVLDSKCR